MNFGVVDFKNSVEFGAEYMVSKSLISNYRFTGTNNALPLEVKPLSSCSYFKYSNEGLSFFAVDKITFLHRNVLICRFGN